MPTSGAGTCAQTLGDGFTQLDAAIGLGEAQMPGVGVGDDEMIVSGALEGLRACYSIVAFCHNLPLCRHKDPCAAMVRV